MPDNRTLLVPGWNGSGPNHWQVLWQDEHPDYELVEQRDWHNPDVHDWVGALHRSIVSSSTPVVLVAHSLGCLTSAWWAHLFPQHARQVIAALLVAPPDLESRRCRPASLRSYPPPPRETLAFPSFLVASDNDPYLSMSTAKQMATDWGSLFVNVGRAGHINAESGFGSWLQGQRLLKQLLVWSKVRRAA